MKLTTISRVSTIVAFSAAFAFSAASSAFAAMVPSLVLGAPSAGSDAVQVTVYGADPNASVLLYHPSSSSYVGTNIGTTNASGYLLTTVGSAQTGIAAQAPVYVMVDGQQSQPIQNWPSYTSSGTLPLSQNTVVIQAGQTSTVSVSVSAALSIQSNSNSTVATAYISGNQIVISGSSQGISNIVVCAANIGCATVTVNVQSSSSSNIASISFSQGTVNVPVGQSQVVTISGSGTYYISSNSNASVASASLSGSTLTVGGVSAGTVQLSVCASGTNSTSCGNLTVNVTGSNTTNTNTNQNNNTAVTFSPSSINLTVGQNQAAIIYGSGVYYISTNSNPSSVSASVNGTNISVTGLAIGGSNIQVCQIAVGCGNIYAYVMPSDASAAPTATPTPSSTQIPSLISLTVASNGANGFIGAGSVLTMTFSTTVVISTPTVTVAGRGASVTGTGSGPYTATYTVSGTEGSPMPISLSFRNTAGTGGSAYISIGASAGVSSGSATSAASGSGSFTEYLYAGMTKLGATDTQVSALQQYLKKLGIYSGPVTGYFGDQTKAAVQAYQRKHGLEAIGVVGPSTRTLLNQGI